MVNCFIMILCVSMCSSRRAPRLLSSCVDPESLMFHQVQRAVFA